jgi:cell wall assembly regulator SMI1
MLVAVADQQRDMWIDVFSTEDASGKVVQQLPWYRSWIPIGNDGAGGFCFADLSPGQQGTKGQLVCRIEPVPAGDRDVFATGFSDYLSRLTACLERGINPSTLNLTS